jgi:hypothetical protein
MTSPDTDNSKLPNPVSTESDEHPRAFISYSWTSDEHQKWVIDLASQLRADGVDVILDKWDLHEGDDAHAFMERMVTDPSVKKVLLVCDRRYVEKANGRTGGVGTEAQIITGEIYGKVTQDKFVAIVLERDEQGKALVPVYFGSRVFIEMSDGDSYAQSYEQLLRWIYGKPIYIKPDLGARPAFLADSTTVSLGTTTAARRALDAIKNNRDYWLGALADYFDTFVDNLEKFRIVNREGEYDDQVIQNIEQFIPYRNEAISIFQALARYSKEPDAYKLVHNFFERLIPYMQSSRELSTWKDWDFDNFRFLIHELFLYVVAIFLRNQWFESVSYLLSQQFYVEDRNGRRGLQPYSYLRQGMESLRYRNERLAKVTGSKRWSIRADLLGERAKSSGISLQDLIAADFLLYIRDAIDSVRLSEWRQLYWPDTLMHLPDYAGQIEFFARAESRRYFDEIKPLLNISSPEDLLPVIEAMQQGKVFIPHWDWKSLNPSQIMGIDKLATKP